MSRRREHPSGEPLNKRLLASVTAREHELATWYAEAVEGRPLSTLMRQSSISTILRRAEVALAGGAFAVPKRFGLLKRGRMSGQVAA